MHRDLDEIKHRLIYDKRVLESIERVYGDKTPDVLTSLLTPPRRLYLRVNLLRTNRDNVLDLLKEEGYSAYPDPLIEEAIYFTIDGPYKINDHGLKVIVDKRAAESIMMGAEIYSPGVVYCDKEIKKGSMATIYSENMIAIAEGEAYTSCEDTVVRRKGLFIKNLKSLYKAPPVRELNVWRRGLVYPQSLPSMIASRLLEPKKNDFIVDMCAAPGGKTSHLFELSGGLAKILAIDHSKKRVKEMIENLERLGYRDKIDIRVGDSRYLSIDLPGLIADKVMLDPPCSSTGVRPKIYDRKTEKDLVSLVKYQEQFLREAYKITKRGGLIVYSTCSITYDENEGLVKRFIDKERLFDVAEIPSYIKKISSEALKGLGIRFHPHKNDSPGHYMILLKKI